MKKLLLVILILSFFGCKKEKEPVSNHQAWVEDIEFIRNELPKRHVNLFSKITVDTFNVEMEDLIKRAPNLTENKVIVELMKIFAKIGDSHTGIANSSNLNKFKVAPLKFEVFDDGVYITDIIESGKAYLKKKVIAIDNTPIDTIQQMFKTIVPHDNEYFVKAVTGHMLRMYGIINGLGISNLQNSYNVIFNDDTSIKIKGATPETMTFFSGFDDEKLPLYRKNNNLSYWYEIIDNNIVYLQYNTCFDRPDYPFQDFVKDLFEQTQDHKINKFIIDLRLNSGGSSLIIYPLIEELQKHTELKGNIYACIGASTFSSGVMAAIYLKKELNVVLVGEPTGAKPNHYGEVLEFNLLNHDLVVRYSTKYIATNEDDDVKTLEPDYRVENYSYHSFDGIDSCIEFIKNNRP